MDCCGGMMGGMGWWMALWGLLGLALLILAVVGAVWLVRNMSGSKRSSGPGPGESAADALERRYARGEIDREEFVRAREDLSRP